MDTKGGGGRREGSPTDGLLESRTLGPSRAASVDVARTISTRKGRRKGGRNRANGSRGWRISRSIGNLGGREQRIVGINVTPPGLPDPPPDSRDRKVRNKTQFGLSRPIPSPMSPQKASGSTNPASRKATRSQGPVLTSHPPIKAPCAALPCIPVAEGDMTQRRSRRLEIKLGSTKDGAQRSFPSQSPATIPNDCVQTPPKDQQPKRKRQKPSLVRIGFQNVVYGPHCSK